MEFWEVIKKRRCIREYKDKEVSRKDLEKILEAGILAPSEGNLQPWRFIVVQNKEMRAKLQEAKLYGHNDFLKIGALLIICIDLKIAGSKYGERGLELFSKQSTAAAAENIFLAATELGLGACWIGAFEEDRIKEILELDKNLRPVILMTIGYPDEKGIDWGREPLDKVAKFIE